MIPRIKKIPLQHVRSKREGMDPKHLENIRELPCVACGYSGGVQAHHLLRTDERGLSRKSSDRWAIPLDVSCHHDLHGKGDEDAFLTARGIDGRAVASALWAARGDLEAMRRVVFRARQAAQLSANALTVRTNP